MTSKYPKVDKPQMLDAVASVRKELQPLREADVKKWAVRANLPSIKKPVEKHLGMPLAERMMHHLWKELPLEGISYHVIPENVLMADFSDMAPLYLLIRCIDENGFDLELVNDNDELLMSLQNQTLEQLVQIIREMHQAGLSLMVSQKVQVNEGRTSEETFFNVKYNALKRVYNEVQPFK